MTAPLCVMLVAGEASGDDRGAGLMRALKARLGDRVRFVGLGGVQMTQEGISSPFDMAEVSILGIFDGVAAYPRILRRVRDTAKKIGRAHV